MNVMVKFDYCDTLKQTIAYGRNRSYNKCNFTDVSEINDRDSILVQWAAINFYPVGTTVKRLFIDFVGSLIIMDSFVSD